MSDNEARVFSTTLGIVIRSPGEIDSNTKQLLFSILEKDGPDLRTKADTVELISQRAKGDSALKKRDLGLPFLSSREPPSHPSCRTLTKIEEKIRAFETGPIETCVKRQLKSCLDTGR